MWVSSKTFIVLRCNRLAFSHRSILFILSVPFYIFILFYFILFLVLNAWIDRQIIQTYYVQTTWALNFFPQDLQLVQQTDQQRKRTQWRLFRFSLCLVHGICLTQREKRLDDTEEMRPNEISLFHERRASRAVQFCFGLLVRAAMLAGANSSHSFEILRSSSSRGQRATRHTCSRSHEMCSTHGGSEVNERRKSQAPAPLVLPECQWPLVKEKKRKTKQISSLESSL